MEFLTAISVRSVTSKETIFFVDDELITPCTGRAVQNEQVFGIVCDYKQIFRNDEARYELLPSHLKRLGILFDR